MFAWINHALLLSWHNDTWCTCRSVLLVPEKPITILCMHLNLWSCLLQIFSAPPWTLHEHLLWGAFSTFCPVIPLLIALNRSPVRLGFWADSSAWTCSLHLFQEDEVYRELTTKEQMMLWEQGTCPGNEVQLLSQRLLLCFRHDVAVIAALWCQHGHVTCSTPARHQRSGPCWLYSLLVCCNCVSELTGMHARFACLISPQCMSFHWLWLPAPATSVDWFNLQWWIFAGWSQIKALCQQMGFPGKHGHRYWSTDDVLSVSLAIAAISSNASRSMTEWIRMKHCVRTYKHEQGNKLQHDCCSVYGMQAGFSMLLVIGSNAPSSILSCHDE